jgi:hypothetical protein
VSTPSKWQMHLGPASVLITTTLALADEVARLQACGEPPLYALTAVADARNAESATASLVHLTADRAVGAIWDPERASLLVQTAPGAISSQRLLYLAYLLLENQLQHNGFLTLHAAAASRDGQAVLLLGPAGAGKTTTLLRLCRDHGAAMVGNDLVVAGGRGPVPQTLAGSRHVRLRHASIARSMPDLLGYFPGAVRDPWRAKRDIDPARLGIRPATGPAEIAVTVFVHVDIGYPALVDEAGDTLVHRLNLYENALRYIRGGSTPWLIRGAFGPYMPALDDPVAHSARTATLDRLLARSRYVAGSPAAVAERVSGLLASGGDQFTLPAAARCAR